MPNVVDQAAFPLRLTPKRAASPQGGQQVEPNRPIRFSHMPEYPHYCLPPPPPRGYLGYSDPLTPMEARWCAEKFGPCCVRRVFLYNPAVHLNADHCQLNHTLQSAQLMGGEQPARNDTRGQKARGNCPKIFVLLEVEGKVQVLDVDAYLERHHKQRQFQK